MVKENTEVLVKALPFNGKADAWHIWSDKFLSVAQSKGYVDALYDGDKMPAKHDQALDLTKDADREMKKGLTRNYDVMAALTMAISDFPVGKGILNRAKSTEFPRGLAKTVWAKLLAKYEPSTKSNIKRLKKEFDECNQKKGESPTDFCSRLITLQNQIEALNGTCTEEDLVAQFESGSSSEYCIALRLLIKGLAKGATLTLEAIEEEMQHIYELEQDKLKHKTSDKEKDVALIADETTYKKKYGKKFDKEVTKKFTGKCNRCGKVGHKEAFCWDDPKNADKRPKSWKTSTSRRSGGNDVAEIALAMFSDYNDCGVPVDLETVIGFPNEGFYCEPCVEVEDVSAVATPTGTYTEYMGVLCPVYKLPCGTRFHIHEGTTHFIAEPTLDDDSLILLDYTDGELLSEDEFDDCSVTLAAHDATKGALELLSRKDVLVADTGASCHVFTTPDWLVNVVPNDEMRGIRVGGQKVIQHQGIGDLPITFMTKDGKPGASVTLKNVKIAEGFGFNLFSLTRAMSLGWNIRSNDMTIVVSHGDVEIVFDIAVETGNGGMLLCAIIKPGLRTAAATDMAAISSSEPGTKMSLMKAHKLFGHPNEDLTRQIAKSLGMEITRGRVLRCEDCTIAKAKQRNLPVLEEEKAEPTEKGQLLHLDMMSIKVPKGLSLSKRQIRLIVDAYTRVEFVEAFATKSEMPDSTCRLFQTLRD
jgi:hypothetical protein